MDLQLHRCTTGDLDQLVWISRQTFIDAFESQNNPDDFKDYISRAFAPLQLLAEVNKSDSLFYFVYSGQELLAYFKLNTGQAQTDIKDEQGIELERIYVLKAFQGRKIGEWMVDRIIELSRNLNKAHLWLGVWEQNSGAIRFYQKLGFNKFGTHPYYIGKDKQTDWLLRLDLGNLKG